MRLYLKSGGSSMCQISIFVEAGGPRNFRFAPGAALPAPRIIESECESANHLSQHGHYRGAFSRIHLAHLRAKHFGTFQGQWNRNSGQRAASGCSTRREPFQPIRPGPMCRTRKSHLLRFLSGCKQQVLQLHEGIGVATEEAQPYGDGQF